MTHLRPAAAADRELLRRLLADYLYEFDGSTAPYPHFDAYWAEPERLPFLIADDDALAGFCLIRVLDRGWQVAEFSVLPEQRRGGIGRDAVEELAARARASGASHLEAKVHPDNREALPFWLAVGFTVADESAGGATVTRRDLG
jgi:ribosomal protein S18 acetylase RimI-like enzyme